MPLDRCSEALRHQNVLKARRRCGHNLILYTKRSWQGTGWTPRNTGKPSGIELYGVNRVPTQGWTKSPKAYGQAYIDDAALRDALWCFPNMEGPMWTGFGLPSSCPCQSQPRHPSRPAGTTFPASLFSRFALRRFDWASGRGMGHRTPFQWTEMVLDVQALAACLRVFEQSQEARRTLPQLREAIQGESLPAVDPDVAPMPALEASTELLVGQWQDSSTLMAAVDAHLGAIRDDVLPAFDTLDFMRNIDTAQGVWLDYLGSRVGLDRTTVASAAGNRFGFEGPGEGWDTAPFHGSTSAEPLVGIADRDLRFVHPNRWAS